MTYAVLPATKVMQAAEKALVGQVQGSERIDLMNLHKLAQAAQLDNSERAISVSAEDFSRIAKFWEPAINLAI